MITAVVDTNVLASGFAGFSKQSSAPGWILRTWRQGYFELVSSRHILTELERAFQAPYFRQRLAAEQVAGALLLLRREAIFTETNTQIHGVATHPEDDLILAAAVSAKAEYLITGDKKLQELRTCEGVTMVSPREFLDILHSQVTE
jgi:uncharacterized protein